MFSFRLPWLVQIAAVGGPLLTAGGPGDLYVRIHTAADTRFARAGADLWREETVPVIDAVLGTRLKIQTLERPVTVHVPAGTQPGTVLRLKGKGLPEFGRAEKGDLLLRILVKIPERLSAEERNLYEQLRKMSASSASRE
jgi:molecular chaperone DnaJ